MKKPYKVKTGVQEIVSAYKVLCGIDLEDRLWDRGNYARASRTAAILIKEFGSIEGVMEAILGIKGWAESAKLSWTIETVLKRASDWRAGRLALGAGRSNGGRPAPPVPLIKKASDVMDSIEKEAFRLAGDHL